MRNFNEGFILALIILVTVFGSMQWGQTHQDVFADISNFAVGGIIGALIAEWQISLRKKRIEKMLQEERESHLNTAFDRRP